MSLDQLELSFELYALDFSGFLLEFDALFRDCKADLAAFVLDLIFVRAELCILRIHTVFAAVQIFLSFENINRTVILRTGLPAGIIIDVKIPGGLADLALPGAVFAVFLCADGNSRAECGDHKEHQENGYEEEDLDRG